MRTWLVIFVLGNAVILNAFLPVVGAFSSFEGNSALVPGRFVDVTGKSGIQFLHQAPHTSRKYLIETMGSGLALFDCNNDGLLDIFLANGAPYSDPTAPGFIPKKTGPEYWDRLFQQKPNGTFEDITEKSGLKGIGYDMGVAVGDYDNDGHEDLYVTGYGGNHLYHNNGLREVLAHYRKNELLIKIGEYKRGADKMGDFAIDNIDKVNKFLKQAVDEKCSFQETLQLLRSIFK